MRSVALRDVAGWLPGWRARSKRDGNGNLPATLKRASKDSTAWGWLRGCVNDIGWAAAPLCARNACMRSRLPMCRS